MSVKQISVFLENKPGTLEGMTAVLAENKINTRAMSLAETKDFGIVRMIVDDVFDATTVLKDADYISSLTDVVAVELPDVPGGLNQVLSALAKAGANVEYMYAFLGGKTAQHAYMILRVQDADEASAALKAAGYRIIDQEELAEL